METTVEGDLMHSKRQAQRAEERSFRENFLFSMAMIVCALSSAAFFLRWFSPLFLSFPFYDYIRINKWRREEEEGAEGKRELALSKEKLSYYYHLSMNDNDNEHVQHLRTH